MADVRACDEPPPGWRLTVLGGAIATVATTAALSFQGLAWWLLVQISYSVIALIGAAMIAWIAARLRHGPFDREVGPRLAWAWLISRLAFLAAHVFLLAAWAIAALVGAPVAAALLDAFFLTVVVNAMIGVSIGCAVNVMRAIRGPVRAGS